MQAKECAERSKFARDPETKRQYEDMARQWIELAERVDKEVRSTWPPQGGR
jgi:hypothetical protein